MRAHLLSTVLLSTSTAVTSVTVTPHHASDLGDASKYRANYTADFQYLTDPSCDGKPPHLYIICKGPNLTLLGTSDDSIECNEILDGKSEQRTTYFCRNDCNATECENVYRYQSNKDDYLNGPFGSITFMCEGESLAQVDAEFKYLKGGTSNGTCAASVNATARRYNYHVARMGVSCPTRNGGTSREYVYDDTYFDCMSAGTFTTDLSQDLASEDIFGCVSGMICDAQKCSFPFSEIPIRTIVPNFFDTCVETSLVGPITAYPTTAPVASTATYSAQFEASWAFLVEPAQSSCAVVVGPPIVLLQCGNDATIQFINATDPQIICQEIVSNKLSCSASERSIMNQFVSVFYECSGPQIPTSAVTYPQSDAVCENITERTLIHQAVTLGVYCETSASSYVNDFFLECAEAEHQFSKTIAPSGVNRTRYTCSRSATFAAGSSHTNTKVIPNVTIETDESWISGNRYGDCRISMPNNPFPTSAPIMAPGAPIPAVAPAAPSSTGDSSSKGAVIGSVVGILTALALLAMRWLWLRRKRRLEEMSLLDKCSSVRRPPTIHELVPVSPNDIEGHTQSYKDQSHSVEDDGDLLFLPPSSPVQPASLDRA